MKKNLQQFTDELKDFGAKINKVAEHFGVSNELQKMESDHACLRLKDASHVSSIFEELSRVATLLSTANVNGREIHIFELSKPIVIAHWHVPCVELPMPKPNHSFQDGWEHIEFVLPDTFKKPTLLDSLKKTFPNLDVVRLSNMKILNESAPIAESDQLPNPTIELMSELGISLKFHMQSIKNVVKR